MLTAKGGGSGVEPKEYFRVSPLGSYVHFRAYPWINSGIFGSYLLLFDGQIHSDHSFLLLPIGISTNSSKVIVLMAAHIT
jgi:hypothetical protein